MNDETSCMLRCDAGIKMHKVNMKTHQYICEVGPGQGFAVCCKESVFLILHSFRYFFFFQMATT